MIVNSQLSEVYVSFQPVIKTYVNSINIFKPVSLKEIVKQQSKEIKYFPEQHCQKKNLTGQILGRL